MDRSLVVVLSSCHDDQKATFHRWDHADIILTWCHKWSAPESLLCLTFYFVFSRPIESIKHFRKTRAPEDCTTFFLSPFQKSFANFHNFLIINRLLQIYCLCKFSNICLVFWVCFFIFFWFKRKLWTKVSPASLSPTSPQKYTEDMKF